MSAVGGATTFPEPTIVVVGSCNVDMTSYLPQVPGPGETVTGRSFSIGFGGKGANQALMARRLGARVALVGCVGRDSFGDMMLANLADDGIETAWLGRADAVSTGMAVIWVEPDGTNRIVCSPGANELVSAAQAAEAVAAISPAVVLAQFEIPQAATRAAFAAARRVGAITVLNPAPAAAAERELLALTDWLVPNEVELAQLTSTTSLADDALRAVADSPLGRSAAGDAGECRSGPCRSRLSAAHPGARRPSRRHHRSGGCVHRRIRLWARSRHGAGRCG